MPRLHQRIVALFLHEMLLVEFLSQCSGTSVPLLLLMLLWPIHTNMGKHLLHLTPMSLSTILSGICTVLTFIGGFNFTRFVCNFCVWVIIHTLTEYMLKAITFLYSLLSVLTSSRISHLSQLSRSLRFYCLDFCLSDYL